MGFSLSKIFGGDAKAPDYGPMAAAIREATRVSQELGMRQMEFAQQQYNEMWGTGDAPGIMRQIVDQQMADQRFASERARTQWDRYKDGGGMMVEDEFIDKAREYSTESYERSMADRAGADAARAFMQTQAMQDQQDKARGINPSASRSAVRRSTSLGLAAMRGDAMTRARTDAELRGMNYLGQAANIGAGQAGRSGNFLGLSGNLGSQAAGIAPQAGQMFMGGLGQSANTQLAGHQMGIGGYGSIARMQQQNNQFNAGQNAQLMGSLFGGTMSAAGAAGGFGALFSDRRLKQNIRHLRTDEKSGLNVYEFEYVFAPGVKAEGVMSDEVRKVYPNAVTTNPQGYDIVDYNILDDHMGTPIGGRRVE